MATVRGKSILERVRWRNVARLSALLGAGVLVAIGPRACAGDLPVHEPFPVAPKGPKAPERGAVVPRVEVPRAEPRRRKQPGRAKLKRRPARRPTAPARRRKERRERAKNRAPAAPRTPQPAPTPAPAQAAPPAPQPAPRQPAPAPPAPTPPPTGEFAPDP